ncbi:hypothetical protein JYU29_05605 [Tianweitania sp. BSSL-BM11]|uniref:Uncharacterized protein n=1 Tax=Tianweitania aestuarii TaxID=2814886 RepID=A0ABS5RT24_9HYPH|nr:hypothetical protein [Tianweitania aestuarii]MBS9720161.1 hypothetical protein [Tianweitania aestuarii]
MSGLRLRERTATVDVYATGRPGPAGLFWDNAGWAIGRTYRVHAALLHAGSSYRSLLEHEASAETEPGIGSHWREAWELIAARAELTQDFRDLQAAIELAASNAGDAAVSISADRAAVSDAVEAFEATASGALQTIGTAVDEAEQSITQTATTANQALNDTAGAAGQAIDQTASAATASITEAAEAVSEDRTAVADLRELTRKDAENTGKDATKTKQDRDAVAADAAMAAAAVRPLYGVQIYRSDQVENGEYAAERFEPFGSVISTIYIELLQGAGRADVHMTINGTIVAGPWSVSDNARQTVIEGLSIAINKAAKVSFHTSAVAGEVHEIWASAYGKYKT